MRLIACYLEFLHRTTASTECQDSHLQLYAQPVEQTPDEVGLPPTVPPGNKEEAHQGSYGLPQEAVSRPAQGDIDVPLET